MVSVSGVNTAAVQPLTTAERVRGQKPEEAGKRPLKPVMDEYIPEEPREPSGRYWMDRGEDGQPRIYFDDPEAAGSDGKPEEAPAAERPEGEKGEKCICNSDKVDREIEKLKREKKELEQRISTETDEAKIEDLERQLAQVERELKEKDNGTYRRRHSTYTYA